MRQMSIRNFFTGLSEPTQLEENRAAQAAAGRHLRPRLSPRLDGRRTLCPSRPTGPERWRMAMSTISLLSRNCTMFTKAKALDEDANRQSLQRFVEFKVG